MTCGTGRTSRVQIPRAANEAAPIAALPLGQSARLMPASSAASADPTGIADAAGSVPTVAEAPRLQAPAPKNVRKPSRVRHNDYDFQYERSRRDNRWATGAYAFGNDRYVRGRYERSWGGSW